MEVIIRIRSPFPIPLHSSRPSPSRFLPRRSVNLRLRLRAASSASGPIDVIGIGSRKDAIIDFCLRNPKSLSSSSSRLLKFWTIQWNGSQKVQLLQRCRETDVGLRNVEFEELLRRSSLAVVLVASSGHGFDHIAAVELLDGVKSAGGLAVAILLKPFSFEGLRRQEEVDALVNKLQGCSHLYIAVEADSLHKTEVETLAEALESANNAVCLTINTISFLMSDSHLKILNLPDGHTEEVKSFEVLNLLETYGEAKICFGSGYNLKSAIMQAVFRCSPLSGDLKDLNGLVVLTVRSALAMEKNDMPSTVLTFRRLTECSTEIIFSQIYEPVMDPKLIVTTLLIVGSIPIKKKSKKKNFLSDLALHFPFLYFILGRDHADLNCKQTTDSLCKPSVDAFISSDSESMLNSNLADNVVETNSEEMDTDFSSRESILSIEASELNYRSSENHHTNEGDWRDQHSNWNIGPGFHIAQQWAQERATFVGAKIGRPEFITLPVGVKSSELCSNSSQYSDPTIPENFNAVISESQVLKGRNGDDCRTRGVLSARAALMLESERESHKSWTPVIELQYRGGVYRGNSQGGLPDGKGRLTFGDGSFYDGMWRYGKRSGLGTFCYSNGDVFQGAWRDDLMHGRGWFYFHTGDRWFANFWKGKANGEGRFYLKKGSIFFGCFRNGWRHGEGQYIDIDGSRWTEVWNEGVLVARTWMGKGSERIDG